jgi:hypothetical protein
LAIELESQVIMLDDARWMVAAREYSIQASGKSGWHFLAEWEALAEQGY